MLSVWKRLPVRRSLRNHCVARQSEQVLITFDSLRVYFEPEQVADAVWDAANRRQVHVTVGRQFRVLNALQDVTPSTVTGLVMKKLSGH